MKKTKIGILLLFFLIFLSMISACYADFRAPWPIHQIGPNDPYLNNIDVIKDHTYRFDCKINNTNEVYFTINRSMNENLFFETMNAEFTHYYFNAEKTENVILSIFVNETTGLDTLISYTCTVNLARVLPLLPEIIFIIIFISFVSVMIFLSIRESKKNKKNKINKIQ